MIDQFGPVPSEETMSDKITVLLAKVEQARKAAHAELLSLYPAGSHIQFTIMHGQKNASTGTVAGISWRDGYIRVKHHQAKERSRYAYRDVHYSQVIC